MTSRGAQAASPSLASTAALRSTRSPRSGAVRRRPAAIRPPPSMPRRRATRSVSRPRASRRKISTPPSRAPSGDAVPARTISPRSGTNALRPAPAADRVAAHQAASRASLAGTARSASSQDAPASSSGTGSAIASSRYCDMPAARIATISCARPKPDEHAHRPGERGDRDRLMEHRRQPEPGIIEDVGRAHRAARRTRRPARPDRPTAAAGRSRRPPSASSWRAASRDRWRG